MTKICNMFRTIVFIISIVAITAILSIFFIPAMFSKKLSHFCAMKWSGAVIFLAKIFGGVDYEIINENNIKADGLIVVGNHCSTWETIFMSNYFNIPVFIIKKTLFFVPIVGQFLKFVGMVGIDRSGYNKKLRNIMVSQVQENLEKKRNVAVFPQGTRVPTSETFNYEKYPFKSGVVMFVGNNRVLTVSNNSRQYFGKGMFSLKTKGKLFFIFNEILTFQNGETKQEIMQAIQNSIENGCKKIMNKSQK